MSTIQATNLKHNASASNNIVLDNAGNATFAGTAAMASSFLRNRIINGNFDFWQRGTTGTGAVYVADRWSTDQVNTTQSRSTDVPSGIGATYSLQVSGSSGTVATSQRIESWNVRDLASQPVTLSFYAKAASGTPTLTFDVRFANSQDNFSSMTIMQASTVTLSTSWARYTFTFNALNANVVNGLALFFYNTSTQTFLISQVQLEVGTAATPFERRQYGTELMLCQRYYYTIRATDSSLTNFAVGAGQSSSNCLDVVRFSPLMRASPTFSSSAANTFQIGGTAATSVFGDILAPGAASWGVTVSGVANAGAYRIVANSTTNAFIAFSAEL